MTRYFDPSSGEMYDPNFPYMSETLAIKLESLRSENHDLNGQIMGYMSENQRLQEQISLLTRKNEVLRRGLERIKDQRCNKPHASVPFNNGYLIGIKEAHDCCFAIATETLKEEEGLK